MEAFKEKVERLFQKHEELITRKNVAVEDGNDSCSYTCILAV